MGRRFEIPGIWDRYFGVLAGLLLSGLSLRDQLVGGLSEPAWMRSILVVAAALLSAAFAVALVLPRRLSFSSLRLLLFLALTLEYRGLWSDDHSRMFEWRIAVGVVGLAAGARVVRQAAREKANGLSGSI